MKKMIGFVLVIVIFAGIGFGVKRFVEGPPQSVNGILVIGEEKDVKNVKKLYKDNTKQTIDYKMKFIITKKVGKLPKGARKEIGEEVETRYIKYAIVNRSTAEQFIKKGIIRARKDPNSMSIISKPVTTIEELSKGQNLFFSLSDENMENNQIDLNGQLVSVQYVKHQAWIGYRPTMDLAILDDQTYNKITEAESTISLIQFNKGKFDYKNKEKINQVQEEIKKIYTGGADKVNFVDVQD